ncbi:nuclear transport factor 2 family protein [Zunongwangia sp. F363]|uniref:Nuclear transport factor 2 family protein n=1 Tax=Autumnicola tepida TaxID=3075595 RepID=A0ABU3CET7_9FLAO|nr:nuclear transport factor 2 family protein [Zunongwangia sp. F363]MDT0644834.1 nuclear transport factor 2 family protein [Zunongwangia sp. F363]
MKEKSKAEFMVEKFFNRVWLPPGDLAAIDELMTEDYLIVTAGKEIKGRDNFKKWVRQFHEVLKDPINKIEDMFVNPEGNMVVCRWKCSGYNHGIFDLEATGDPISFTGIAIWEIREDKFCRCWVERSALEIYRALKGGNAGDIGI